MQANLVNYHGTSPQWLPWGQRKVTIVDRWPLRGDRGIHRQAFSQMGVQASSGRPLTKASHFIFDMLPYKLFI